MRRKIIGLRTPLGRNSEEAKQVSFSIEISWVWFGHLARGDYCLSKYKRKKLTGHITN